MGDIDELQQLKERKTKAEQLPSEQLYKYFKEYLHICDRIKELEGCDYSLIVSYAMQGVIYQFENFIGYDTTFIKALDEVSQNNSNKGFTLTEMQSIIEYIELLKKRQREQRAEEHTQ